MMKKYPQLKVEEVSSFSVPLDELLSWPYWYDFIKLHSKFTFASGTVYASAVCTLIVGKVSRIHFV